MVWTDAQRGGSVLLRSPLVGSRTSDPLLFGAVPGTVDEAGDAHVHQRLTAPSRCLARAVLINPLDRDGVYIAASGRG